MKEEKQIDKKLYQEVLDLYRHYNVPIIPEQADNSEPPVFPDPYRYHKIPSTYQEVPLTYSNKS